VPNDWELQVKAADTVEQLYAAYQAAFDAGEWTDELTSLAAARKTKLAA
jgi:hypothetical protein